MKKLYLLSADIYRQAYLQILSADIVIGRTLGKCASEGEAPILYFRFSSRVQENEPNRLIVNQKQTREERAKNISQLSSAR